MEFFKKAYNFTLDFMQTVLLAASIFLVIYIFLFRPFQVSGSSMFPTFKDKEYVLTNLIGLKFRDPQKGDVIVFHAPPDPEKDFIKRVMALPGDTVYLQDGNVYVNDKKVNDLAYIKPDVKTYGGSFLKEGVKITVPQENYIVMGDNRPYSSDSREWGYLPKDKIIGTSLFVYWPLNKMRIVRNPFN